MDLELLFSQLIRIDGLDIWNGLSHVGCNRTVYADTLKLFCIEVERKTAAALDMMEQKNWKEYATTVHGIKGGFSGIGAWKIEEQAKQLENAAWKKEYAFCQEHTAEVCKTMVNFVAALRATVLFHRVAQQKETAPLSYLAEKFNALHWACFSGNCTEAEVIAGELETKTFDPETDALVETICGHVENLDYDLALKDLDLWLSRYLVEKPA